MLLLAQAPQFSPSTRNKSPNLCYVFLQNRKNTFCARKVSSNTFLDLQHVPLRILTPPMAASSAARAFASLHRHVTHGLFERNFPSQNSGVDSFLDFAQAHCGPQILFVSHFSSVLVGPFMKKKNPTGVCNFSKT